MTTQEFSDAFDTLLNTYNTQARFGEAASKAEIALDEYEKSVLLTQAQDQIVKSYFDARLNSSAQGMDDSERRQVDFSTLITNATLSSAYSNTFKIENTYSLIEPNVTAYMEGYIYSSRGDTRVRLEVLFNNNEGFESLYNASVDASTSIRHITITFYTYNIISEFGPNALFIDVLNSNTFSSLYEELKQEGIDMHFNSVNWNAEGVMSPVKTSNFVSGTWLSGMTTWAPQQISLGVDSVGKGFDDRGILYSLPTDILFILNEKLNIPDNVPSNFVVKPMHYREYDREMSKAYAQPLKKQVWRLFNNNTTGFDLVSELIPSEALLTKLKRTISFYKIRYIKRPTPIILVDLPNGLNIDGHSEQSECTLNPILHQDILNEAFRLAVTTRGGTPAARQAEASQRRRDE